MLTDYFDAYAGAYKPYKGGAWCYEDGCIYRGLELLHRATGEDRWLDHLHRLIAPQVLPGPALLGYDPNEYNIDHVMSGKALLYLHEVTGEDDWLDHCGLLIDQLATHPRTRSGVYWHKLRYPWQVWLDGLYMGVPVQIAFGLRTGNAALVDDGLRQVGKALEMAWRPETSLYAHAVDEARKQPWADPETGQNPAHWTRALGWLAMALVDIAEMVGPDRFRPLEARTRALFARLLELRRPSGLWWQVPDRPDLPGNYEETSGSAMLTYALLTGARQSLAEPPRDLAHVLETRAMGRVEGRPAMMDICEVAGLGWFQDRFRDGTADYYLTEARVADDAKGVGPMMMAGAAALRAGRSQDSAVA